MNVIVVLMLEPNIIYKKRRSYSVIGCASKRLLSLELTDQFLLNFV